MIKLKNLWKIALAAMTMSTMLVACEEASGSTEKEVKTTQKSETGVYSYTVDIEKISTAWGGKTESPAFSILLLTDTNVKTAFKKGALKASPITAPELQIGSLGNMKVASTAKAGNYAVYGMTAYPNPEDSKKDMYKYYDGVAATVTDDKTLTVTVDMNKLTTTQLKALWLANDEGKECVVGDADSDADVKEADVNLADYKPYVLALASAEYDADNCVMTAWDADLMVMQPATALPANPEKNAPVPPTCNDLNSYAGSMTGDNWPHLALTDNAFTFKAAKDNQFVFTIGSWDFKVGGAEVTELGKEFKLAEGDSAPNITFKAGVLTEGAEYTATLVVKGNHEAYVKVTAK